MRQSPMTHLHTLRIRTAYEQADVSLFESLKAWIGPHAEEVANAFYEAMLQVDETEPFLNNDLVTQRLRFTMADWVRDLLIPRSPEQVDAYIERQRIVGNVHARINIPMGLVNHGMSVIKQAMGEYIREQDAEPELRMRVMILMCELVDQAASIINESYVNDLVIHQRNEQALRLNVLSKDVALECEHVRAGLFDWLRNTLTLLHQDGEVSIPNLTHSEVGMWVLHKAEMMFPGSKEVSDLGKMLRRMDDGASAAKQSRKQADKAQYFEHLQQLNQQATDAAWLLSALTEHSLKQEDGRDPLTRVLNRRYLPVILQRETEISIREKQPFTALMLDIDHFKRINDQYGHPVGDRVLRQFSEIIISAVRTSDFVFRMGGEEFLVLLVNSKGEHARAVAEKLRAAVEAYGFDPGEGAMPIQATVSIGVATHDGHPDYNHVLKQADEALYAAKQKGRNRVV